jgi:carbon storage regulator CsrA
MLVITRNKNQGVWIGNVRVEVVEVGQRVRLGIHAGADVAIERDELRAERIAAGRPLTVNVARAMGTKGGAM